MAIPPRRHPIRTFLEAYPHVWYLLIWIVYLMLFWLAEHLIVDKYWVSYLPIDDQIPFCRNIAQFGIETSFDKVILP